MADFTVIPDFPIEERVITNTIIDEFENGVEQRRSKWSRTKRQFNLSFTNAPETDYETLRDFYIAKNGQADSFTFDNPNDGVEYTVRFVEDSFKNRQKAYKIYDMSCSLIQVF